MSQSETRALTWAITPDDCRGSQFSKPLKLAKRIFSRLEKDLCVPNLRASFAVDSERLKGFGIIDPRSAQTQEIFKSGQLSSDERLYLSLWGSPLLSSITFEPKRKIIAAGEPIEQAYLIVSGTLVGTEGDDIYRFGPGSVLGLAEGVVNKASKYSVITVTPVQARVIPLHRIDAIVAKLPVEVRSIMQTIIKRTLALT
jgi:CRP-like cAMP-binding protein